MSYIPTRDRFYLDDTTAERLADLAEDIETKACIAYCDDEGGDPATTLYRPGVDEVLADLRERGLLRDLGEQVTDLCSTDVDEGQVGDGCRLDHYGVHQCERLLGHDGLRHVCRCGHTFPTRAAREHGKES